MKLELKHITPYAPYGLDVVLGSTKRQLTAISLDSHYVFITAWSGSREKQMAGIESIKPILRPISDLIKEIEHNGERFVPIIQLAKMDNECKNVDFEINEFGNCIGRLNAGVMIVFQIDDELPFIKEIHNNIFGQISGNDFDDMHLSSILPSEIREKLFEWHFDLFNLIDQNLAINLNDI